MDVNTALIVVIAFPATVAFVAVLRQIINGILWRLRVGAQWLDVPGCYGPW